MNYKEARDYINKASGRGIVPGLQNIERLCKILKNPQDKLKIIHIAGTNGKGSTGAFIEAVLRDAGLKTGRFSSPAVFDYLEQWQINGNAVSMDMFAFYMGKLAEAIEKEDGFFPTQFEMEAALAFLMFCGENCDMCVIEAGMGGEDDATNVIKSSLVSVMTPISLDHTRFLGNSIGEIAKTKSGIIKENGIIVTAEQENSVTEILQKAAAKKHAELIVADSDTEYEISLQGEYQKQNSALAAEVCRHIDGITEENIKNGLKNAVWRGRFEKIHSSPKFYIDGAHNPHGARALIKSINHYFKNRKIIYITGVFADKDYEKIAEITAPLADKIYTVTPPSARGLDNTIFAEVIRRFNGNVEAVTLTEAVRRSLDDTDAVVIAFGSLSFLADIKDGVEEISAMKKYTSILHDSEFLELLSKIDDAEKDRIYCKHNIEHLMDVARAGYIINLEQGLNIPKEIVYGAALMHDIGRYAQYGRLAEHHIAGADAARRILPRCGYTDAETELIADAVKKHRQNPDKAENLADVIAEADKKTRMCMLCPAADTCKWAIADRNINTVI